MAAPAFLVPHDNAARLADPALRDALLKVARRRLPPGEVDDLVQNTLTDALSSSHQPREYADFRRWVQGIARHKIADLYRRQGRLPPLDPEADPHVSDPGPATEELAQWIERELPKTEGAQATLHWLLRESEGETLDEIAREAALPAPRVRQRVSRLRRHFQTRWLALGAAGLALLIAIGLELRGWHQAPPLQPVIAREAVTPLERARALRDDALQKCRAEAYPECVAELDEAKALDPIGDDTSAVRDARSAAQEALRPVPPQTPERKAPPKRAAPKTKKTRPRQPLSKKGSSDQKEKPFFGDLPVQQSVPTKSNGDGKKQLPTQDGAQGASSGGNG
jgi:RNA polymerase sigma factor (sigma-70 family)